MSILSKTAPFVCVGTCTEVKGSQSKGIYVYRRDPLSGKLTLEKVLDAESGQLFKTGNEVQVSMPVCLKFAYLK
jgi:6-phosphogluconolactonase (cycloisomerase 2 family)